MNPETVNVSKNITGSPVLEWVTNHWLLVLICGIILLLLIFLVIIPGIFSLIRRSKKIAETKDLKKDLMAWKNLRSLVQGGDKAQDAKNELSLQLQSIRMMLKQGIALLNQSRRKKYDVPWFMILGEPQAGKSELLKMSSLDLHSTANLESSATLAVPLNCWIGPKTFVLDVSGKVFFDRWLEGSSAEWDYLIKLLKKLHRRRPLDGIILTIPADALIADDPELCKQKAALIGSELYQLLHNCGMNLPCHVVVTKMDMLLGFREYFSNFAEEDRNSVFGWANHTPDGVFEESDFNSYYDALIGKIRNGSMALMLNKELFQQKSSAERMAITGKSYLFADSLAQLRKNLSIYLSQIFGDEGWNGHEQSILSGVFFTSARDNGVVLSPGFAETAGKPLEEAVIVSREQKKNQSFFIRNFLKDLVFSCLIPASFTAKERFKRQLPGYFVCLILATLGVLWLSAAFTKSDILHEKLQTPANYYNILADNFAKKNIDKSPLVELDSKGMPQLLSNQEMTGYPQYSRLQFFYDAHSHANENIVLPAGFRLSSLIQFGLHPNPAYYQRQYIFNMIQSRMSFLPTVKTLQNVLLAQDEKTPFTRNKREAVFDFSEVVFSGHSQNRYFIPLDAMLLYLFPGSNAETINLLASYQKRVMWNNQHLLAQIIYHYDYSKAQQKAFDHFFHAWKNLSIYPETIYPQVRGLIRNSCRYADNQKRISALAAQTSKAANDQKAAVALWDKLQKEQNELESSIRVSMEKLASSYPESAAITFQGAAGQVKATPAANTGKSAKSHVHPAKSLLQTAIHDYRKRLKADKKEIYEYIAENRQLLTGRGREVFFKIEQDAADSHFAVVEENLKSELQTLNGEMTFLRQEKLFAPIESNPPKEVKTADSPDKIHYHIFVRLNKLVSTLPAADKLQKFEDFSAQWKKNNNELQAIIFQLDEIRKQYENIPEIQKTIDDYKKLVTLKGNYNRNILISELMQFCPKADAELLVLVGKLTPAGTNTNSLHVISPELVKESIGKLNIPPQYEPTAALQLFTPWNEIRQFKIAEAKNPAGAQFSVQIALEIKTTFHSYLDNYLKFWGTYPATLTPPVNKWSQFREFCRKMKPYEVNSLLLAVYKSCAENLSAVPASLLSPTQEKYRETLLADINAKIQMLTPHFSGICIRQVNSWSLLPQKPEEAYQFLHSRNDKELLSDYLAMVATGNKGDIPWWSKFFQNGIALLRNEAGRQIFDTLNQADRQIFRFPLCRDAVQKDEFRPSELSGVWETLKILSQNFSAGKDAVRDTASQNNVLNLFNHLDVSAVLDKKDYQWLDHILLITDALTNRNKPLLWTLSIPDLKLQKKFNDAFGGNTPLAMHRYRYFAVSGSNKPLLKRQVLSGGITVKGDILEKDLSFDFFAHSDENKPAGSLKIAGNWPVIRLYLTEGSYYELEKKTLYVPLRIRDSFDAPSILWVGITFNQMLPLPENWPSSENWPDFSNVQKNNKYQTINAWDLIRLINESDSYGTLMKKLERKTFKKPPVFEIAIDEKTQKSILAKYRYAEVILPGQPPRRIAIGPGTVLTRCDFSTPEIKLKFYPFANSGEPSARMVIAGPYAPLKLLMVPGKIATGKASFQVPGAVNGEKLLFKVDIK